MSATAPHRRPTEPPPSVRDEAAPRPGSRRRHERRVWGVGLLVSVLAHLVLLLLATRTTLVLLPREGALRPPSSQAPRARTEMQAVNLVVVADAGEPDRPEARPVETKPEDRPDIVPAPRPVEPAQREATETPAAEATTAPSTVDRLRPRMGDPRVWQPVQPPPPPEKSDIEIARERVYARIQELNDSLALEADAARRATDWTITDGNGGKWGISPGKVHLGNITLPLPIGYSTFPGHREENRDRAAKDAEIKRQSEQQDARDNLEQRAGEIRKRKDEERKGGSNSGNGSGGG